MRNKILAPLSILFLLSILAACNAATPAPFALATAFPAAEISAGWAASGELQTYTRQNLFDLVDGQAESFFAYGFEQVAVQRYLRTDGNRLNLEIWQLADSADAYGLYSASLSGESTALGNDGALESGQRLVFWQNCYYVALTVNKRVADEVLLDFGKAVAAALPGGGERPALVGRLPAQGLQTNGFFFFHEEISIQSQIWLGGQNLLGLGPETDGVVARYDLAGRIAHLLLVQYPTSQKAAAALQALQSGAVDDLAASAGRETLLAAVFGNVDAAAAQSLLQEIIPP